MQYQKNGELPEEIQQALSVEAQTLYREVFNRNFPEARESIRPSSEEMAHKAAWRAVRENFEEINGKWVNKMV